MQSHSVCSKQRGKNNQHPLSKDYNLFIYNHKFVFVIKLNAKIFLSTNLFKRSSDYFNHIFTDRIRVLHRNFHRERFDLERRAERRNEKRSKRKEKNQRRTGLFYDSHGRTIVDPFVTFGEEFSQEGQEVAGVKRSSRIFAKRCLHYRLLPLSKRPSSRYYIVSKRICNRHLPSFGLRFEMFKLARQNGSSSLRFSPLLFLELKTNHFFSPLSYPHFEKSNFLSSS